MNDKKVLSYLKTVLISQLLLESNDELNGTNVYKHNIKNQVNKLNKMLEPIVSSQYSKVYKTDPEMTTNIINKMDSLITRIAKSDIDELVMLDSLIRKYYDDIDWFKENGKVEFLKLD